MHPQNSLQMINQLNLCHLEKFSLPGTTKDSSGCLSQKITGIYLPDYAFFLLLKELSRDCLDDGFVAGMIMPSMVSLGLLHNVLSSSTSPLSQWLIEDPQHLPHSAHAYSPMQALVLARYNLVDMSILCSSIFILHVCASWWLEARHTGTTFADGERRSVPRGELRRSWRYFVFTCLVTIACIVFHGASSVIHWGFWQR